MPSAIGLQTLYHADWSAAAQGRWVMTAQRVAQGWQAAAPRLVGPVPAFVDLLFAAQGPVLAGFDFPIGLPAAYGQSTGLADFPTALTSFGHGVWSEFYQVAATPEEVSPRRPFYPRAPRTNARQIHLLQGLGVGSMDALRRRCDYRTAIRPATCPMFWTLGPNQVGKATISGWQEVVVPAVMRGAGLWPFEGSLTELAARQRPVLAEAYPAEAYRHIGITLPRGASKRRQADRRLALAGLPERAAQRGIRFPAELIAAIGDGFGNRDSADDAFDCFAGLLGMIEVVDGRRLERPAGTGGGDAWEGWILGQAS